MFQQNSHAAPYKEMVGNILKVSRCTQNTEDASQTPSDASIMKH